MNKVKFQEWECDVVLGVYRDNNRISIQLVDDEGPVATASVNMPEVPLAFDEVIIKDYSENEGMFKALVGAGIVRYTGINVETGYITCPVCKIIPEEHQKIASLCASLSNLQDEYKPLLY